jgi:hypothetical protein
MVIGPAAQADRAMTLMLATSHEPTARRKKPNSIFLSVVPNSRSVNVLNEGPATLGAQLVPMSYALSNRSPLNTTSNDAPISAVMAAHRDAKPIKVRATKTAFTPSEKAMFCRYCQVKQNRAD